MGTGEAPSSKHASTDDTPRLVGIRVVANDLGVEERWKEINGALSRRKP